jgi:tetratricopeptide (TPR) repeat protein
MEYGDTKRLSAEALASLRQGDKEARAHKMDAAAIAYARASKQSPNALLPHLLAGVALLSANQPKVALPLLRKAIQIESNDLITFRLLEGALVDSGDSLAADALERDMARRDLSPSASIRRVLEWAQLLPDSPTVFLLLGDAHQLAQEWNQAEQAYQKTMQLAPRWVRPRMNSAMALLTQGRAPEATRRLEDALKLEPRNAQTQFFLGDAYLNSGRTQDAIYAYQQVQKNSPLAVQALLNIAQAHAIKNDIPAAVSSLSNAAKMAPLDPVPQAAIGEMQMRNGEYSQATTSFSAALTKADPTFRPLILRQLAQAYTQAKQYDNARRTIQLGMAESQQNTQQNIVSTQQNTASWYCLLARVARAQNDSAGVEAALKNAIETDSDLYATETLSEIERSGMAGTLLSYYQSLWQNTSNGGVQARGATIKSVANTKSARVRSLQALAHLARNASQYATEVRVREDLIRLRTGVADYYLLALAYDHNGEIPNALAYYNKTRQLLEKQPGTFPRSEVEHLLERIRTLKAAR